MILNDKINVDLLNMSMLLAFILCVGVGGGVVKVRVGLGGCEGSGGVWMWLG